MTTPRAIITALGVGNVAERLGVSRGTVRQAQYSDAMPAAWYSVVSEMCAGAGLECPMRAFNFKSPSADAPASAAEG